MCLVNSISNINNKRLTTKVLSCVFDENQENSVEMQEGIRIIRLTAKITVKKNLTP